MAVSGEAVGRSGDEGRPVLAEVGGWCCPSWRKRALISSVGDVAPLWGGCLLALFLKLFLVWGCAGSSLLHTAFSSCSKRLLLAAERRL